MDNNTESTEIFSKYEINSTTAVPRMLNTKIAENISATNPNTTTRIWRTLSTTKALPTVSSSFNSVVLIVLIVLFLIAIFFTCRRVYRNVKLNGETDREENEKKDLFFIKTGSLDDFFCHYFETRHFDNGGSYDVTESKTVVRCK